ncbi:hypothetical protein F4680DRAFT_387265 [Xylaria scruposa]|nr:hypothetical protein F4680DRAFT_387265 [Xylaria scruposa]
MRSSLQSPVTWVINLVLDYLSELRCFLAQRETAPDPINRTLSPHPVTMPRHHHNSTHHSSTMPIFRFYFYIACVITAFTAPMIMAIELFILLLFTVAPLLARAPSDEVPLDVIDALEVCVCLMVILILVDIVQALDYYLSLRALPEKFFELLGSF